MWNRAFAQALAERAIKTFAQAAAALLVGSGLGLLEVDWLPMLSVAGMATLVSVLTSVGSNAITGTGPSITDAEQVVPDDGPDDDEHSLTMTAGG